MESLLATLLSGVVGGNVAGIVLRNLNIGLFRNILFGGLGGLVFVLSLPALNLWSGLWPEILTGVAGGAILALIVGALINLTTR